MLHEIPWGELLEAVFRQRRVVLAIALPVLGLSLLSVWLTPDYYRTAARIQLTADPVSEPRGEGMSDRQVQAELAFLRSPLLISRVFTKLGETKEQEGTRPGLRSFFMRTRTKLSQSIALLGGRSEADLFEHRVRAAAESIEVEPIGRSNLVKITYTATNPSFAAGFVNGLLAEHVERITELGKDSLELPFIQSQLDSLVQRWQEARRTLDTFRSEYGDSVMGGDEAQLRSLVSGLEAQRVATETNVLELRARVDYLETQKLIYPETVESEYRVAEPETVKLLEAFITDLQMKRSEALTRYTPTSLFVRQLEGQIEAAQQLLASKEPEAFSESATTRNPVMDVLEVEQLNTMTSLSAAEARVAALSGQIETYRAKLIRLEATVVELQRLQNEVDSAEQAYQAYLQEAETVRQETARGEFGMVNIAIVEPAEPPHIPEPSRGRGKIMAGGLLGLLLGLACALLRDWLDPSIKSSAQASRLTGLRVLAEIPYQ